MDDSVKHSCGLFGVYGHRDAARLVYLGLYSLQHRGEEAAGIVTFDGKTTHTHKGMGLVSEVFNEATLHGLPGRMAVGHTRVAHNGNLVNAFELRQQLEANGSIFQTTVDSEIILHLLARATNKNFEDDLVECLRLLKGAFTLLFMTERELIGARDPNGFRPLCIGRLNKTYVLASETCALDIIGAKFVREVEPGEVVLIGSGGVRSLRPFKDLSVARSHCLFEHVYF
ncbi:MAG: amidophosphoribosyltransferase, partial [Candidatus Omnitrophica bacterium]|nr:amidophosphoribosyltransferase [Candidatus Omnitrophota bacterium]